MTETVPSRLTHLFDAELIHQDGLPAFIPQDEYTGSLVGTGGGSVAGSRLRGTLRWSNYETVAPDYCQLTLIGEIATEDGALIRFSARGFALPPAGKPVWSAAAAVRFSTDDARYRWLVPVPAIWEGEFDEEAATAQYHAYLPASERPPELPVDPKGATRIEDMVLKLHERFDRYGPGNTRLLVQIVRELANGQPLAPAQVDRLIDTLGLAPDDAHRFLREVAERDANGDIIGALGLSQGDSPHRLSVAGVALSAWCALDTLFLPALLQQVATVESPTPGTGERVHVRVSPEGVDELTPADAVISIVLVDLTEERTASVEAVWTAFCHHVHFFATRGDAERWAHGRDDITILSVAEGYALGRQLVSTLLARAA